MIKQQFDETGTDWLIRRARVAKIRAADRENSDRLRGIVRSADDKPPPVVFAFDCDHTLIDPNASPPKRNKRVCKFLKAVSRMDNTTVHCWSNHGEQYARDVAKKVKVHKYVDTFSAKDETACQPDVSTDNEQTMLGRVNILVNYTHTQQPGFNLLKNPGATTEPQIPSKNGDGGVNTNSPKGTATAVTYNP